MVRGRSAKGGKEREYIRGDGNGLNLSGCHMSRLGDLTVMLRECLFLCNIIAAVAALGAVKLGRQNISKKWHAYSQSVRTVVGMLTLAKVG